MGKRDSARTERVGREPLRVPDGALLGAHMSIAGGTWMAARRAQALGATALQLFVKNNNRWVGKPLEADEGARFREAWREAGRPVSFAHNTYLVNLASAEEGVWRRSVETMVDELTRCDVLGLAGLVAHPGAHMGSGEEKGLERIGDALEEIMDRTAGGRAEVWLETTAGQGTSLGWRFEHLAGLVGRMGASGRMGVCLDTCHVFAAGYDVRTRGGVDDVIAEFEAVVGLGWLRALHVNDSRKGLGSRVDRHAHLGEGHIGPQGLRAILAHPRLAHLPKILETPKGTEGCDDWINLQFMIDATQQA